jgi:hypothetical protein
VAAAINIASIAVKNNSEARRLGGLRRIMTSVLPPSIN